MITGVASDNRTITLSQASPGSLTDQFNFVVPAVASITGDHPTGLTPIKALAFDAAQQAYAGHVQNVYLVMSTMSPSVKPGTANASIPLLGNIIGGNVGPGFLPNENAAIMAGITNQIKSALRGVPYSTSPPTPTLSQWYPDPAKTGGARTSTFLTWICSSGSFTRNWGSPRMLFCSTMTLATGGRRAARSNWM